MTRSALTMLFFGLSFLGSLSLKAQNATEAANYYDQYTRYKNNGLESAAYPALYQCYEEYTKVLADASLTAYHAQAKAVLKELYPGLHDGAFYYTGRNDQTHALQFAQAYISLSMMPAMQSEALPRGANYAQLSRFAASGTWNRREHAKAIPYLYAYLTTGDAAGREEAFLCIGQAYYEQKDYVNAKQFLTEGLRQYPSNLSMLSTIINTYQDLGDMDGMQPYLAQALSLRPTDEALLNLQGMAHEKNGKFEQAIECYRTIQQSKPQSLEVAKHLAQDYYNAGVQSWMLGKSGKRKAEEHFRAAEPLLRNIMASDPLSVKHACALANVYSLLGENAKLQDMNGKLTALGVRSVDKSVQPALMDEINTVREQDVAINNVPSPITPSPVGATPFTPQPKKGQRAVPDVDINIPENKTNNNLTFAVIIANENYIESGKNVPMALNDGRMFAEYCNKTLGIPRTNIRTYENATSLRMRGALRDVTGIARACHEPFNIIFYYAGHGVPDVATQESFLMPVDGTGESTDGYLSLDQLYLELGELGAQKVCVFLDACFSGAARGGGMLASARGVEVDSEPGEPQGNMVIFSATSNKETALPYEEQKHGLFTYYLLKKLQETKGNVTLEQLGEYLTREVSLQSQLVNRKAQTPTVTAGLALGDKWKKMKLR